MVCSPQISDLEDDEAVSGVVRRFSSIRRIIAGVLCFQVSSYLVDGQRFTYAFELLCHVTFHCPSSVLLDREVGPARLGMCGKTMRCSNFRSRLVLPFGLCDFARAQTPCCAIIA